MKFRINTSWDGDKLDYHYEIKFRQEGDFIIMEVDAPYFYDEYRPRLGAGLPTKELWKYEVVGAFFLGTNNMYLDVELSPHGQHLVVFHVNPKSPIKTLLPLEYAAKITTRHWHGEAKIPIGYFPPNPSLFNAFASWGKYDNRQYAALYPAWPRHCKTPDFHRLNLFKYVDFDDLIKRDKQLSKEWKEALDGKGIEYDENVLNSPEKLFRIKTSWDGEELDYHYDIKFKQEGDFVIMEVDAPFFKGKIPPGPGAGLPTPELWKYEVVEAFFLGTNNMYLEVELAPHGQHLVLFLADPKNPIKMLLPLEYTAKITEDRWHGEAKIPIGYFPPSVTSFNAYAIHGQDSGRKYAALYPAPPGQFEDPDFHRLNLFKPFDFDRLVKRDKQLSEEWKEALNENGIEYDENVLNSPENTWEFKIMHDWENDYLNQIGATIKLRPEEGFVLMEVHSPFYASPKPKGLIPKLWKHEVVLAHFYGSSKMYLEVELSPHGKYVVILLATPQVPIKMDLPLEYTAKITGRYWTGKAKIPVTYFPPGCTLFNAHALYGPKYDRRVQTLYPPQRGRMNILGLLFFFRKMDFEKLIKREEDFTKVWRRALTKRGIAYRRRNFKEPDPDLYNSEWISPEERICDAMWWKCDLPHLHKPDWGIAYQKKLEDPEPFTMKKFSTVLESIGINY